jgi:hypothetical protein
MPVDVQGTLDLSGILADGRITEDGDLTVQINPFYYDLNGTKGYYIGSVGNSIADGYVNYVYLDLSGVLAINITGYPYSDMHIRLGRVVASVGFIVRVISERAILSAGNVAGGYVIAARQISTTSGLTGGGDLSDDRTLSVNLYGDGSLAINNNKLQIGVLANDGQHGNLGGDLLHSAVTGSTSGFMTSPDKLKLDSIQDDATYSPLSDVTPSDVDKSTALSGADGYSARRDHKHDISTASATAAQIGDLSTEGFATSLARSDHTHEFSDGYPIDVSTSNLKGSAVTFSRSDHQHSHGQQTEEDFHALVTGSTSGFMFFSDKLKLDSIQDNATYSPLSDVTPSDVDKSTALAGADGYSARRDHKHDISTASATAAQIGDLSTEGFATSLARSDHTHEFSDGYPIDVSTSNLKGSAVTFSRSDHQHNLPFSTLNTILDTADSQISFNNQNLINVGAINGQYSYGPLNSDPISPIPLDGYLYYNTVSHKEMEYDGYRSKWLSISTNSVFSGASGNTAAGSYFRGMDGLAFTADIGIPVAIGTLTGILVSVTSSSISNIDIYVNSDIIETLGLTGTGLNYNLTLNADFNVGLMKFRNRADGTTVSNTQITALYKERS